MHVACFGGGAATGAFDDRMSAAKRADGAECTTYCYKPQRRDAAAHAASASGMVPDTDVITACGECLRGCQSHHEKVLFFEPRPAMPPLRPHRIRIIHRHDVAELVSCFGLDHALHDLALDASRGALLQFRRITRASSLDGSCDFIQWTPIGTGH